jgi:predicted transcriptional regulator
MPPKRVLKSLSLTEKFKIIKEVETGARKKDVATKYKIPASTLSTILKNKSTIINVVENIHGGKCEKNKRIKKRIYINVDTAVLEWFKAVRAQNLPVSGAIIKQKALELSVRLGETNFKASTRWLDKWKRRYVF